MNLLDLGTACGTDKGSFPTPGASYLHHYARLFQTFQDRPIRLLELGVREGGSLRMWKAFFPLAQIVGVDIDPACQAHKEDRIDIVTADQGNLPDMGQFDIIIDDASHVNTLTLKAWGALWPKLNPGGVYAIEDLKSSYDTRLGESIVNGQWPGMQYNDPEAIKSNDRATLDRFFVSLIQALDHDRGGIASVQFFPHLAIMVKA